MEQDFNTSKSQTGASIILSGAELPDSSTADEKVLQWNYSIYISNADIFTIKFHKGQDVIEEFENIRLYGSTTFFMKKDECGLCQYGFTTKDENTPNKKNTYISNLLAEDNVIPCDLSISYYGEGYGLIYAEFTTGDAYLDYDGDMPT